jgi:hypothetical protein
MTKHYNTAENEIKSSFLVSRNKKQKTKKKEMKRKISSEMFDEL